MLQKYECLLDKDTQTTVGDEFIEERLDADQFGHHAAV